MRAILVVLIALGSVTTTAAQEKSFFLKDGQRVVFLGDSITFAGKYIAYLDAYLFTRFSDSSFELLNLGLPSETASGLSEPDHPFPRPTIHTRLDRALELTQPDVVVICYGMNDGIYHPPSKERMRAYREGIEKVLAKVKHANATPVLMTPPPFDPVPIEAKVVGRDAPEFGYKTPYHDYDRVLAQYSQWLLTLRDEGYEVIDLHRAINNYLAKARELQPKYSLAGDGIHPNATGHWLIAQEIIRAWEGTEKLPPTSEVVIDYAEKKSTKGDVTEVECSPTGVAFTWKTRIPMPTDSKWDPELTKMDRLGDRFNALSLQIEGLPAGSYRLFEGKTELGEVSRDQLTRGIDLNRFPSLSLDDQRGEILTLVAKRQQMLGRAWLTHVGHDRPNTPKGTPLKQARDQAIKLEREIRELAKPTELSLRVVKP